MSLSCGCSLTPAEPARLRKTCLLQIGRQIRVVADERRPRLRSVREDLRGPVVRAWAQRVHLPGVRYKAGGGSGEVDLLELGRSGVNIRATLRSARPFSNQTEGAL